MLEADIQYKTAFVLMHKLQEAMEREATQLRLTGEVGIKGAYFGDHVSPTDAKKDRVDRQILKNRSGKRWVVVLHPAAAP